MEVVIWTFLSEGDNWIARAVTPLTDAKNGYGTAKDQLQCTPPHGMVLICQGR